MKKGITGSTLKLIAVITMMIDHIGAVVVERAIFRSAGTGLVSYNEKLYVLDLVLRSIGRIAFPIFCFLLVEGFLHTKNRLKYAGRLTVFAFLSEIPFNLAFKGVMIEGQLKGSYQNVMFTMLIGFLMMILLDYLWKNDFSEKCISKSKKMTVKVVQILLMTLVIWIGFCIAELLCTDYSGKGIIAIAALYLFRHNKFNQAVAGVIAFSWEFPAPLAFLPILIYNGKKGLQLKYFFYLFYPLHLLVLYFVAYGFGLV